MANSNIENEIILLSIDKALDDVDFIVDKSTFYTTLKKTHGLKRQDIPICFNVFHKALKEIYGVYHYRIRTQIVKHIHELDGNEHYSRNEVRSAFIKIMKAFNADSMISSKELEKVTEERMAKIKANERLAIIGETAGMVGHDIRNPLQAIVSDVYLLKDYLKAMPNISIKNGVAESLDGIEQCVDYINKIVLDLQDFVKPLVPNFKETNLEMILDQVLVKKAIPENIKVNCKVEPEAKNLISDPDLLKRILANLINNAVQAMPNGGKLIINAIQKETEVILSVEDTGKGIPENVKSKLFMPLFTTKSKGQGFGLAVVKRMTEALGGQITFDSILGKGTKFTINLPTKQH